MAAVIYDLREKFNVRILYSDQEGVLEEGELFFIEKEKIITNIRLKYVIIDTNEIVGG